jgi:hypothetical protein
MKVCFWNKVADDEVAGKRREQGSIEWFPVTTSEREITWESKDHEAPVDEDAVALSIASQYAKKIQGRIPRKQKDVKKILMA